MAYWVLYKDGRIIRLPEYVFEAAKRVGNPIMGQRGVAAYQPVDNTEAPIKFLRREYKANKIFYDTDLEAQRNAEIAAFSLRTSSADSYPGKAAKLRSSKAFR